MDLGDLDDFPGTAAYERLAAAIRAAVSEGRFDDGQQLPTESELIERYGLGRQTVRRAFQDLVAEGLIYRVRGRGTFPVLAEAEADSPHYLRRLGTIEDLLALSVDTTMVTIEPLSHQTNVEAAGRLRCDSDLVIGGTFLRLHEDQPFSVTQAYLPLEVGRRIMERGELITKGERLAKTIIGWVDETSPNRIEGAHQSVVASAASESIADLIDCPAGAPTLRIDRLYFDADKKPLELAISYFNPKRYSYRVELRRGIGSGSLRPSLPEFAPRR